MTSTVQKLFALCEMPAGSTGRICQLKGDDNFNQRLREIGFGEAALVTKISGSSTSLCRVKSTRIALNHNAARCIWVEMLPKGAV